MANNIFLSAVVSGAIVMGYTVVGLFFLRFWKQSRDRLFAFFALAFFILGVQRLVLALTTQTNEGSLMLYVIRLLAFGLILAAIIDKNRGDKKSSS